MRNHEDGRPHMVYFGKNVHDPLRRFRIQVACRLVRNKQQRPVDDSSGNGYTLLFTAAQILRQLIGFTGETD